MLNCPRFTPLVPLVALFAQSPRADAAPHELMTRPPSELGLDAALTPMGDIVDTELTEAMRPAGKPLLALKLRPRFASHHCYALAAAANPGAQLFIYASNRAAIVSEDYDKEGKGKPISVGFCVARDAHVDILLMSNRPTRVSYRLFTKSNHMQEEQERDLRTMQRDCLANCERQYERCPGTYHDALFCNDSHRYCINDCHRATR